MPEPSLLLLIPAYNEEARIEPVLREYADFFGRNYSGKFQLVVILNGCRDNTLGAVQRAAKDFPRHRPGLIFRRPSARAVALIEGLQAWSPCMPTLITGYVDADGATGPAAVLKLLPHLKKYDCVIGSRWLSDSVLLQAQPTFRRFISRCFHLAVETLFWLHIKDTQCPCKLMHREAAEKIQGELRIADLSFDVNLLVALKRGMASLPVGRRPWNGRTKLSDPRGYVFALSVPR